MNEPGSQRFLRQMDICSPEKLAFPIVVIGAGAIGAATVLTLAKMGCANMTVWDADTLEDMNIPNQWCKPSRVGSAKVEALRELVEELTDFGIAVQARRYMGQRLTGVVICTVDNMKTRQMVWDRVKGDPSVALLIDARMGAEFARIYCVRPNDVTHQAFYEENLYPAEDAERLPCSARSIIFCPTIAAGLIAAQVKAYAMGEPYKREILIDLSAVTLFAQ